MVVHLAVLRELEHLTKLDEVVEASSPTHDEATTRAQAR
jgi:hypothetical protein